MTREFDELNELARAYFAERLCDELLKPDLLAMLLPPPKPLSPIGRLFSRVSWFWYRVKASWQAARDEWRGIRD